MRTNTLFTNVQNGTNIYMTMIEWEKAYCTYKLYRNNECYDVHIQYKTDTRNCDYKDSQIQSYIILHATCSKIIFISVKYKQMNVMMYTYTTEHMRYCVYKDSQI